MVLFRRIRLLALRVADERTVIPFVFWILLVVVNASFTSAFSSSLSSSSEKEDDVVINIFSSAPTAGSSANGNPVFESLVVKCRLTCTFGTTISPPSSFWTISSEQETPLFVKVVVKIAAPRMNVTKNRILVVVRAKETNPLLRVPTCSARIRLARRIECTNRLLLSEAKRRAAKNERGGDVRARSVKPALFLSSLFFVSNAATVCETTTETTRQRHNALFF